MCFFFKAEWTAQHGWTYEVADIPYRAMDEKSAVEFGKLLAAEGAKRRARPKSAREIIRLNPELFKYFVEWKGWPKGQGTFEDLGNLVNCNRMIENLIKRENDGAFALIDNDTAIQTAKRYIQNGGDYLIHN